LGRISKVMEYNFFEDVMREYGLTAMFSPQLNIHIAMGDYSKEETDHLMKSLSKVLNEKKVFRM